MQTDIDFLKLEKDVRNALASNNLKFQENRIIPEISILLNELGLCSFQNDKHFHFLLGTTLLLTSSLLIGKYSKDKSKRLDNDTAIIIQEALRNTETYKICLDTYNQYLDKYIYLLNILGIKDSDEISIIYQFMLDNGLLSYNKNYHYDQKKISKKLHQYIGFYELDELSACKIATGVGVCRHSSSQLTDIQNRVGNPSYNFYVEALKKPFQIKKYTLGKINHQYTVTQDKEGRYSGYCTTSKSFITLDYIFADKYIHTSTMSLNQKENSYENIIPLDFNLLINNNKEMISNFLSEMENSFRIIDPNTIKDKYKKIKDLILDNEGLLEEFYQNTKGDLKVISDSYNCIVPSNDKIKYLKIR